MVEYGNSTKNVKKEKWTGTDRSTDTDFYSVHAALRCFRLPIMNQLAQVVTVILNMGSVIIIYPRISVFNNIRRYYVKRSRSLLYSRSNATRRRSYLWGQIMLGETLVSQEVEEESADHLLKTFLCVYITLLSTNVCNCGWSHVTAICLCARVGVPYVCDSVL